jgi:glycosyltransferase involved in cell wall biosynthesis
VKTCVLIPTYNNAPKIYKVIEGVLKQGLPVLIVNDGSTDETLDIIEPFKDHVEIVSYDVNKGKGFALMTGFRKAKENGFDTVITIDSDGQHDPNDIQKMLEMQNQHPGKVLMGSRDLEAAGAPSKSSFGNKFSNFWFHLETGIKLPDTQTGFRSYPLNPVLKRRYLTKRFGFEVESIVKLAWRGVEFLPVKIAVDYPEDRITHFKPFKDFTLISFLNTYLVTLGICYYIPRRWIKGKN